jgi:hypothetical protein
LTPEEMLLRVSAELDTGCPGGQAFSQRLLVLAYRDTLCDHCG